LPQAFFPFSNNNKEIFAPGLRRRDAPTAQLGHIHQRQKAVAWKTCDSCYLCRGIHFVFDYFVSGYDRFE